MYHMRNHARNALETKGYEVISSFDCGGHVLFTNRGHPTEDDLKNAKTFVNNLMRMRLRFK